MAKVVGRTLVIIMFARNIHSQAWKKPGFLKQAHAGKTGCYFTREVPADGRRRA